MEAYANYANIVVSSIIAKSDNITVISAIKIKTRIDELCLLYNNWKVTKPKLAQLCKIDILRYLDDLRDIEDSLK